MKQFIKCESRLLGGFLLCNHRIGCNSGMFLLQGADPVDYAVKRQGGQQENHRVDDHQRPFGNDAVAYQADI